MNVLKWSTSLTLIYVLVLNSFQLNAQCDHHNHGRSLAPKGERELCESSALMDTTRIVNCDYIGICFEDMSVPSGMENYSETWGGFWGLWDNDLYPDIYLTNHRNAAEIYVNNGDGTFRTINFEDDWNWIFYDMHSGAWGDFNKDGDQDLMITSNKNRPERLIENNGNDIYSEIGQSVNLHCPETRGRAAIWFDAENDGDLDVFIAAEKNTNDASKNSRVFINDNNTFTSLSSEESLLLRSDESDDLQWGAMGDVNNDGQIDLIYGTKVDAPKIVTPNTVPFTQVPFPTHRDFTDIFVGDIDGDLKNETLVGIQTRGPKYVMLNDTTAKYEMHPKFNGPKIFKFNCSGSLQLETEWVDEFGENIYLGQSKKRVNDLNAFIDINNPDIVGYSNVGLFNTNGIYIGYDPDNSEWRFYFHTSESFGKVAGYITSDQPITNMHGDNFDISNYEYDFRVYEYNEVDSEFEEVSDAIGIDDTPDLIRGFAVADFDNDMDLDIYVVNGDRIFNAPNKLYVNDGTGNFNSYYLDPIIGTTEGTAESAALVDYDLDGRMDFYLLNGWSLSFDAGPGQLFRNTTPTDNHWLEIDLIGNQNTADGIGAIAYVYTSGQAQMRTNTSGAKYRSQDHIRMHFGMGPHCKADSIEIRWPDGTINVLYDVLTNQLVRISDDGVLVYGMYADENCEGIPTSVTDNFIDDISIYPNPTNCILNVDLSKSRDHFKSNALFIRVTDLSGRELVEIERQNAPALPIVIDQEIEHLADGMYMISIYDNKEIKFTQQFVIARK